MGQTTLTNWTNQTNLKINKEQLDAAKEMQQREFDYQTDMWNKTNEYNTPSAQKERFTEAGFNPYLMMSGSGSVPAQAMNAPSGSVPSAIPVENPATEYNSKSALRSQNMQALADNINQLGATLNQAADRDVKFAQAENIRMQSRMIGADLPFRNEMNNNQLRELMTRIAGMRIDNNLKEQDYNFKEQINPYYKAAAEANSDLVRSTQINMDLQNLMLNEQIPFIAREASARLANLVASTRLTEAQTSKVGKELESIVEDIESKKISNKTLEKRMDALLRSADLDNDLKEIEKGMKFSDPAEQAAFRFYTLAEMYRRVYIDDASILRSGTHSYNMQLFQKLGSWGTSALPFFSKGNNYIPPKMLPNGSNTLLLPTP